MTMHYSSSLLDGRVAIAKTKSSCYENGSDDASRVIARCASLLGWSDNEHGPFGTVIAKDAKVVIKPNLVMHENQGPGGIEPLITHSNFVRATVEAALQSAASEVIVGDAPLQACDFDELLNVTGLDRWARRMNESEPRFRGIRDFRRTTCQFVNGVRVATEELIAEDRFVLFDLADDSLLEPVTDDQHSFRVTCYDPRLLAKKHSRGCHQYLVAKDVIDADVIINLPKLKTHKKAGITCALKNLIGINGNKEFLPHHRIGGSDAGGDCYPGGSRLKRALEYTLDLQNKVSSFAAARIWSEVAANLNRVSTLAGDNLGVEGSWSGNNTIWRTGLDLNRILLYGRSDGSLADTVQRRVIHLVDAVVAGQGDGPLCPDPLPLGLFVAGSNAAAIDWVGAQLLGYIPERIPIARESFKQFRWPITAFTSAGVTVSGDFGTGRADDVLATSGIETNITHPAGWRDAARTPVTTSVEG